MNYHPELGEIEKAVQNPHLESVPIYPNHNEVLVDEPEVFTPESYEYRDIVSSYQKSISNPEQFVGQGNNAIVFDTISGDSPLCTKILWKKLDVEIKDKRFDLLPLEYNRLRQIQEYFRNINEERRERQSRGADFVQQNSPKDEAVIMEQAREILRNKGLERFIPHLENFLILSRTQEGDQIDDHPFYLEEEAHIIQMEKINGASIEDLIVNYQAHTETIESLDLEAISKHMHDVLSVLHEQGFVHGDVSIRNILIDFESGEPRLIDYGTSGFNRMGITTERDKEHLEECLKILRKLTQDAESIKNTLGF